MTDESDKLYMKDARAKSVEGLIAALAIFAKYLKKGQKEKFFTGASHDVLYFYVDLEKLPEDSEDGRILVGLGFHADEDSENWAYFT